VSGPTHAWAAAVALLALGGTGCGLKGPLTLPPPSENVIIRGPGDEAAATPPEGEAAASDEAQEKPRPPVQPAKEYRTPPPALPGANSGIHDD
jgi:predicted small lipoprotein YifL